MAGVNSPGGPTPIDPANPPTVPSPLAVKRPRAMVVVNPTKIDTVMLRAEVRRKELAHGWDASLWRETTVAQTGASQAAEAVNRNVALVVAVGGDGTVRAVSDGLSRSGMAVGIVPAGTGNLLARNLGLPINDVPAALEAAFTGRTRRIDVGRLRLERADGPSTELSFVVMAGMGIDARMILNTDPALKERIGWLAYIEAIAKTLSTPSSVNTRFSLDNAPWRTSTINTLLIGNCGDVQGHLRLLPDARLDDGKLDYIALRSLNRGDRTRIARWLSWENSAYRRIRRNRGIPSAPHTDDAFRYGQARQLTVHLDHPEPFEVDGDDVGEVVGVEAWCDRGALSVRVPQHLGVSLF
ncbi:MAG: diacylglycerol kinase [Glaciihabitans sp.]|nr:diacylglycerol kinase [Glaciihabitans sp.]